MSSHNGFSSCTVTYAPKEKSGIERVKYLLELYGMSSMDLIDYSSISNVESTIDISDNITHRLYTIDSRDNRLFMVSEYYTIFSKEEHEHLEVGVYYSLDNGVTIMRDDYYHSYTNKDDISKIICTYMDDHIDVTEQVLKINNRKRIIEKII